MDAWPLSLSIPIFVAATAVIVFAGTLLSRTADRIADETGWGEAFMGALLLASVTSLPDLVATLTAVLDGRPELGMSNVMGSMAANLAFLAIADLTYRKANLEHAAASSSNLMLTGFMLTLLVIPLLAMTTREVTFFGVHPGSLVLLIAYPFGFHLIRRAQESPMWIPRWTRSTIEDRPVSSRSKLQTLPALWMRFGLLSLLVSVAGYFLMSAGESIATHTRLSDTAVGGLLTALSTSTPELVTTVAAVRAGAPVLAVGNILGTNCFNTLIIAVADVAHRGGSIYQAISSFQLVWGLTTILMAGVLLLGFVHRQEYGIARMGFESFLILVIYVGTATRILLFS